MRNSLKIGFFLLFIYLFITTTGYFYYLSFGFVRDSCYHVNRTRQIMGLDPEITENCYYYDFNPTYPSGFHIFASVLIRLFGSETLVFLFILPAILVLAPLFLILILLEFFKDCNIVLISLTISFLQFFIGCLIYSISYTRWFVIIIILGCSYLSVKTLKLKSNYKYLVFPFIVLSILITLTIHRLPDILALDHPSQKSVIEIGIYIFIIPFLSAKILSYLPKRFLNVFKFVIIIIASINLISFLLISFLLL